MEWIKSNLPLVTILLIILSSANLFIFYKHFNVEILSYMDFTEVLQAQFSVFAITVGVAIILNSFVTILSKISRHLFSYDEGNSIDPYYIEAAKKYREAAAERKAQGIPEPKIEPFFSFKQKLIIALILIIIHVLAILCFTVFNAPEDVRAMIWVYSVVEFTIISFVVYKEFTWMYSHEIKSDDEYKSMFSFLKIVNIFVILTYSYGVYEHLRASYLLYVSENEVTVNTDKRIIKTSEFYRYLGKTKDYVFFFDIKKSQAEVFPASEIKLMEIRNGIEFKKYFTQK